MQTREQIVLVMCRVAVDQLAALRSRWARSMGKRRIRHEREAHACNRRAPAGA